MVVVLRSTILRRGSYLRWRHCDQDRCFQILFRLMVDGWGVACARGGQPEAGGGLLDDGSRTRKILIVIPVLRIKLDLAAQAKERLTGLTPLRHFGDLRISEALVVFGNLFGKLPARTQVVVRLKDFSLGTFLGGSMNLSRYSGTSELGAQAASEPDTRRLSFFLMGALFE